MPTLLQTSHGKVTGLWGSALLRGADGKMHALKLGDEVFRGDVILTTQDGIVQLTLDPAPGTRVVEVEPDGEIDITPGAGLTGGEGGDLQPGLRVERIVETLTPAAALVTAAERDIVAQRPLAAEDPQTGNAPPVATPGSATGLEDSTLPISLRGTDRDGVVTFVTVVALPANATLLLANGTTPVAVGQTLTPAQAETLLFRPAPDFNGPAHIEFTVTDDFGATSAPASFEIAVTPVNDAPLARADVASTAEDTPVSGNLLTNDSDPDGDRLAVA
ncbi:MAG: Ig-like domain-containing protein, partial [Burkholderiaceae bacterium]